MPSAGSLNASDRFVHGPCRFGRRQGQCQLRRAVNTRALAACATPTIRNRGLSGGGKCPFHLPADF